MKPCPVCGCKPCRNTVIRHLKAVESRAHFFFGMVKKRVYVRGIGILPLCPARVIFHFRRVIWHHEHISEVTDSRSRKVSMREADDKGIAIVIPRAPVPLFLNLLRPELDHAEWH